MKNALKKTLAGVTALTLAIGGIPVKAGIRGLFKGNVPVAYAQSEMFNNVSLTLGDDLGLNFFAAGIDASNFNNYTVKFTGQSVNKESGFVKKGNAYCATAHIYAKNMNKNITATLYEGDTQIDTCTYSVNQYLDYQIAHPIDEKTTAIVNATKQYGLAAANYFKNAENTLNFGEISASD